MLRRKNPLDKIKGRNYTGDADERLWLVAETNHGTNPMLSKSTGQTKLESNRNNQIERYIWDTHTTGHIIQTKCWTPKCFV